MDNIFLILLALSYISVSAGKDVPCAVRETQYGAVCVCNASYCDTVERPPPLAKGRYYRYTTSSVSPGFHRYTGRFTHRGHSDSYDNSTFRFTVNRTDVQQEILGFGGTFTDATGVVVNSLPQAVQEKFFQSYFSDEGIEYSMGRVPMGGTDFSPRIYTYDDEPYDEDLKYFKLADEDFKYKIPNIQKALKSSPYDLKIIGNVFTSPKWMKTNYSWTEGYIKAKYFDTRARYHIRFLDAYAGNGIKLWSLTGGNEVMLGLIAGVLVVVDEALPHDHIRWMRDHLMPQLASSSHSDIKLLILDDMRMFANFWMSRFALQKKLYDNLYGAAMHWYADWVIPDWITTYMAEEFHRLYPDKVTLYTESSINVIFYSSDGEPVELGSWERAGFYIYSIIKNLNLWVSGYLDWNLALDTTGGPNVNLPTDAAIIVNASSGEFYKNPIFYGLGHFSKFIPPGSRRVTVLSHQNVTSESNPHWRVMMSEILHRNDKNWSKSKLGHFGRVDLSDFKKPELPKGVYCLATTNSNNSSTIIVFNSFDTDVQVRIEDSISGIITTKLEANSLNTFVFWSQ